MEKNLVKSPIFYTYLLMYTSLATMKNSNYTLKELSIVLLISILISSFNTKIVYYLYKYMSEEKYLPIKLILIIILLIAIIFFWVPVFYIIDILVTNKIL